MLLRGVFNQSFAFLLYLSYVLELLLSYVSQLFLKNMMMMLMMMMMMMMMMTMMTTIAKTYRAVEDKPLAVGCLRHGERAERHGQYAVGPLVRHGVELAVQLTHRDRLRIDHRIVNLVKHTRARPVSRAIAYQRLSM